MYVPRVAGTALKKFAGLEPLPQPELLRVRYPVVLMHGFGMLAGLLRGGHLYDEAMDLRMHGVLAYSPNVAPYNTVRVRADMWKNRLERILEETGAERLNLVAHSMGGLDARYLISQLGMHEVVATLTTVSSPHHGSPIAEFLLEQPGRVQSIVTDICNWMGSNALQDCTADFLTTVHELTTEHLESSFNPSVPDRPEVRYWSYAGAAGKGTEVPINPVLRVFNGIIFKKEGINDGFVSVGSAQWGTYLGTIEADHARQVGINLPRGGTFRSRAFYREVVRRLGAEGF